MEESDFGGRAARDWGTVLPKLALTRDELSVAIRSSRLYLLQRALDEASLRQFQALGIAGVDDFRLLAFLRRSDEKGLTNAELVSELGGSKAGMSNRLDRLVRAELIERVPLLSDRRVHNNALTPHGQRIATEAVSAVTAGRKAAFDGLSEAQIATVAAALEKMIRNLNPDD